MRKKIIIPLVLIIIILIIFVLDVNNKNNNNENSEGENMVVDEIKISVNNEELIVKLEDNSSSRALVEKLKEKDLVINAEDYGNFEKVGSLGFTLPTNDITITTTPGDLILYQGNQITLYYDTNTWTFTRLGKVKDKTKEELKEILGSGDVVFTLFLNK